MSQAPRAALAATDQYQFTEAPTARASEQRGTLMIIGAFAWAGYAPLAEPPTDRGAARLMRSCGFVPDPSQGQISAYPFTDMRKRIRTFWTLQGVEEV